LLKIYKMNNANIKEKTQLIDDYCSVIIKTINNVYNKSKMDKDILKLKEKVNKGMKIDKVYVIMKTGPYLYEYREVISNRNIDFFKNFNFDDKYSSKKNYSEGRKMILTIRKIWENCTEIEKNAFIDFVQQALILYLRYVKLDKN
jgi:hypothetical protein